MYLCCGMATGGFIGQEEGGRRRRVEGSRRAGAGELGVPRGVADGR
jgi:hypothetical protein